MKKIGKDEEQRIFDEIMDETAKAYLKEMKECLIPGMSDEAVMIMVRNGRKG